MNLSSNQKELEELKKEEIDAKNRAEELYDEYIDTCKKSGDNHYDNSYRKTRAGRKFDAHKLMESKYNVLHGRIGTIETKIRELKGSPIKF